MRFVRLTLAITLLGCQKGAGEATRRYGVGHPASAAEIAAVDIDVGPDGVGLPPGSGSASQGEFIFAQKCASCHGTNGAGNLPQYPALVGRDAASDSFAFAKHPGLPRTIGNYWGHATTLFDYIRRAMPLSAPGSLTNDETYAVIAYLLAANQVLPAGTTLDATALKAVTMPAANRFVRDNRRGGKNVK